MRTPDPQVLEWAAAEKRVLLTHDIQTMVGHAWERVRRGLPMSGVVIVSQELPRGAVLEQLEALVVASREGEWEAQVLYVTSPGFLKPQAGLL